MLGTFSPLAGVLFLILSTGLNAESGIGNVFHFTDPITRVVVMQAEFPAAEVCEAFKEMALADPGPAPHTPSCSSELLDARLPVSVLVDYSNLGFAVGYRFNTLENCRQFVKEFRQAAAQQGIGSSTSSLQQNCIQQD